MSKFIPYESRIEYMAAKFRPIKFLLKLYYQYNKFDEKQDHAGTDERKKLSPFFLGGLNPLIAMSGDLLSTFKAYKSRYYIARDLLQPLLGLGNIISGIFNLIASPIILLMNIIRYAKAAIQNRSLSLFLYNMGINFAKNGGGFLEGITRIVRGITQLVTTPLTLVLRMPIRGIITAARGMPTFVESFEPKARKIEKLINRTNLSIEEKITIDRKINRIGYKMKKALKRGQILGAEESDIKAQLQECHRFTAKYNTISGQVGIRELTYGPPKESALAFLNLFSTGNFKPETQCPNTSEATLNHP